MGNLKLSHYTIPVKLEKEDGKYLLIHGYTGAIDIVDESIIEKITNNKLDKYSFDPKILDILIKRGYLTTKSIDEEINHVTKLADLLHRANSKLQKSFSFFITYNCNFRCPYCFENTISNCGKNWPQYVFDKNMVNKAFEAMFKIEPCQELHNKNILLYGGEPFLKENKDIVKYIIEKGKSLGYKFKAITNGYDIDSFEDILSSDTIYHLQITLDGDKEHHDNRRKHYLYNKSFDKIISNIGFLLKKNIPISVRINIDNNNFKDLDTLISLFKELKYTDSKYFKYYTSVLREYESSINQDIKYLSMTDFADKHLNKYGDNVISQDFGIYKKFCNYFKYKKKCELSSASCSAQYGSYMFDPKGDIYTCLETVGKEEHIIGHYNKEEIEWTKSRDIWFSRHTGNTPKCNKCKFSLLCGGSCLAITPFDGTKFGNSICRNFPVVFPKYVNKAYNTIYLNN